MGFSYPKASYETHRKGIDAAVRRVMGRGIYLSGPEVPAFENEFSRYLGGVSAAGVSSGTDALHLALWACGISAGDRVATVSHTASATIAAIELTGAIPVLVDIDPGTYTMDPKKLKAAVSRRRIKAVIPVHLYGHPAAMPEILKVARKFGSWVIEDCAQSLGALVGSKKTGLWGDAAAFSFYPTKNLGAAGDAGAVVARSDSLIKKIRKLREYGWEKRFVSEVPGRNARMDEIQAAILRVKLKSLDRENQRRREIAGWYRRGLGPLPLILPEVRAGVVHAYHQWVIRTSKRDALKKFLNRRGVPADIHYPVPVHLQRAYRRCEIPSPLLETERVCRQILSLPMHPYLEKNHVDRICVQIREGLRHA